MKVIASAAVSADGYIDDRAPARLILSNTEDWAEVYAFRAECDGVLVGAETVRKDNPSLVTRDESLRAKRKALGKTEDPMKITVTASGNLDPESRFFQMGSGPKLVIAGANADKARLEKLAPFAHIVSLPSAEISAKEILDVLRDEGLESVLVEGGRSVLQMFFRENLVDEFRLAVAPVAVGDARAPQLFEDWQKPFLDGSMRLCETKELGGMTVVWYERASELSKKDEDFLATAITLSKQCLPSGTAFSVGVVIVTKDGKTHTGYSRETQPTNHAEEEAIAKALAAHDDLRGATIYVSMEPCSERKSKLVSCTEHIVEQGISKVIFAASEPEHFVNGRGEAMLEIAGVEVVHAGAFTEKALEANKHLFHD